MMRIALAFCLVLACEGNTETVAHPASSWDYADKASSGTTCTSTSKDTRCGPASWKSGTGNEACAGEGDQSPINAPFAEAGKDPAVVTTDLVLSTAAGDCANADFEVNQHTAEVVFKHSCPSVFTATFKGVAYELVQFHYHSPSEHTVDGTYYPMEVHHVHSSGTGYLVVGVFMGVNPNITEAKCPDTVTSVDCSRAKFFDAVLTLGLADKAAAKTHVQGLGDNVNHYEVKDVASTEVANDPYANFIPPMTENFFHYTGSFTTPPCTTGVVWILNPTAVPVFESSIKAYRELINALKSNQLFVSTPIQWDTDTPAYWDKNLGTNNRPIQTTGTLNTLYRVLPAATASAPCDSSASSGSGDSLAFLASWSHSVESDSSATSASSTGCANAGSSGSFMAIWKWLFLGALLCCIAAIPGAMSGNKGNKGKRRQDDDDDDDEDVE